MARHLQLVLRVLQGLDYKRARTVNPTTVAQLYSNLESLYEKHCYPPNCVWNVDETSCQPSQSGLTKVFAKRSVKVVHKIIPGKRKWVSVLIAINASGRWIPNYYIFKGVRKMRNYMRLSERGATQRMQRKGWVDSIHFMEWMDHFIHRINQGGAPPIERHLLILDGHKSYINLEVLMKAKYNGIDNELQSLDKAYFKPFKVAFRAYRDVWNQKNHGMKRQKEGLVQWTSLAFQKALTRKNSLSGFRATRIWLFNPTAMVSRTDPSQSFRADISKDEQRNEIYTKDCL